MDKRIRTLLILNILIPVISGALYYYLFSPDIDFIIRIDAWFGINGVRLFFDHDGRLFRFVRNYLPDMLWAYSLFFSVYVIVGNKTAKLWKILLVTGVFSVLMEVMQLTPYVHGTFDFFDIVVELFAGLIAVFVIKNFFIWEERDEKE